MHDSTCGHSMRGIEQQVGKHLTQGARINQKTFTCTVACLHTDALSIQPRLVEVDDRMQQPRHISVLRPYRASKPVHRAVCDLRNPVYFFLGEREIVATLVREGIFGVQQIEEVQ